MRVLHGHPTRSRPSRARRQTTFGRPPAAPQGTLSPLSRSGIRWACLTMAINDGRRRRLPIWRQPLRSVRTLVSVGGWRTALGKVNNTLICGEDYEVFLRLRRLGLYVGISVPAINVRRFIPAMKARPMYFASLGSIGGKTVARMANDVYRRTARRARLPAAEQSEFVMKAGENGFREDAVTVRNPTLP